MKKIKIIGSLVLVVFICIGGYFLYKKDDYSYYLALGDYMSNKQVLNDKEIESFSSFLGEYLMEAKEVNEVNHGYLKNNMTSKKLLEMIEKDSYKIDNSSLVDLIKKSKYITISLGMNDILGQIKYDSVNNELIYDKDLINNRIEVFKHNYHEIVEEIKDLNRDASVILIGCYSIYGDKEISSLINSAISEVSIESSSYYVDLNEITDRYMYSENELYLNNIGQEFVYNKVVSLLEEIEKK